MKTIAITIDEDMLERIDRIIASGAQPARNRSQFIRDSVRDHLGQLETKSEEDREREIFRKNRTKLHRQAVALIKEQAKH